MGEFKKDSDHSFQVLARPFSVSLETGRGHPVVLQRWQVQVCGCVSCIPASVT